MQIDWRYFAPNQQLLRIRRPACRRRRNMRSTMKPQIGHRMPSRWICLASAINQRNLPMRKSSTPICNLEIQQDFERLVHRYERELYTFLRRFLGDVQQAEDVFQATFLSVHFRIDQFEPGDDSGLGFMQLRATKLLITCVAIDATKSLVWIRSPRMATPRIR